ncbi:MAG: hypothetical protein KF782_10490 [Labilithrix sp.]|nr:hypothetical protein [Labilithrix sp.]
MTRTIDWSKQAVTDLLDLPDWRIAQAVDAAVKLFALTGVGTIVTFPSLDGPDEVRLYAGPHARYYAVVRYSKAVVYVERVLRSP